MTIQINQGLCAGCGVCMEACPDGAIQLVDNQALIDDALCSQCKACLDACPNGAISEVLVPERSAVITKLPAAESSPVPAQIQSALVKSSAPGRGLAPLAGAALAFLGNEVAPRLIDVLVSALERRLARPAPSSTISFQSPAPRSLSSRQKGNQRQVRCRRGRPGYRKSKESGRRYRHTTYRDGSSSF